MFGGRGGDHNRRMFCCSYSLYFASPIRDESRTERRAMVLEAANAIQEVEGGVPLLVSSTEALRNHH